MLSFKSPPSPWALARLFLIASLFTSPSYAKRTEIEPSNTAPNWRCNATTADPIANLNVTLRQTDGNPPTFRVTVKNQNNGPVTFLDWYSPLDPLVVPYGIVRITLNGESKPLNNRTMPLNRWLPIPQELVGIESGRMREEKIVFDEKVFQWLYDSKGINLGILSGKATVHLEGWWDGVWLERLEDVVPDVERVRAVPKQDLKCWIDGIYLGPFKSNAVELRLNDDFPGP
ncbi:hypothetical protein ACJZ2D_004809 [Fusarium nematophilum]